MARSAGLAVWLAAADAAATPGQARRLGGVEAQGPATSAVTALHHNPAMLATMPGSQFAFAGAAGLDHLSVRRFEIGADGSPTAALAQPVQLVNPAGGYFVGASFMLDPVAIGAGVYDLSSRYRPASSETLGYHLAPDPDLACAGDPARRCPDLRSGGAVELRTDFTLGIAWDILDRVQLGVSLHFPRLRAGFAHDTDTSLGRAGDDVGCSEDPDAPVEDPGCAERLRFHGRARLRWFGLNPRPSTRFDFAATMGIAVDVGGGVTLGARFRTRPVLNRGTMILDGEALVCRPDGFKNAASDVPACANATPVQASVGEELGREAAVGAAVLWGRADQWHLDGNFYWFDGCPGGVRPGECGHADARRLSLVGLDRDAAVLPESLVYRGRQDVYGVELWNRWQPWRTPRGPAALPSGDDMRVRTRIDLLFGAGFSSPGTRPAALTAAASDGWTISASLGTGFEVLRKVGSVFIVPGYGIDFLVPTRVGPGGVAPAFDPTAGPAFEASGGDINDPAAAAILEGRARPTNAGIYTGAVHTLVLGVRWAERATAP